MLGSGPGGSKPTVAAFDFDGTLTRGGSVFAFLRRLRGNLRVAALALRASPSLLHAAMVGGQAADQAKERFFVRLLAGLPRDVAATVGRSFAEEHLRRRLRPEVAARLEWHRALGHRIVVVSASPELYVGPAGQMLGADAVLATRLAVDGSGRLTGAYLGRNCRGSEKYIRVQSWIRDELQLRGAEAPVVWAYGNSRGDLRLLEAADHPVDAGRLGRLGRLRRFPSLAEVAAGASAVGSDGPVEGVVAS